MNPREKTNLTRFEIFPNGREKLGFGISQIFEGIWPGLELFQTAGENGDLGLLESQLRESDSVWNFFQTVREKLRFGTSQISIGGIWPDLEFFQTVGEKLRFGTLQISIGESNPIWKFFQIVEEKLKFEIFSNLNWGIWPSLKIFQIVGKNLRFGTSQITIEGIWPGLEFFPNSRGKIEIWDFTNLNWGIWPGLEFFQTVREKLRFETLQISIGESDPVWSPSKQSGKNWDLGFTQISIGGIWPDLESFQIIEEKLGFGIYTNLN